MRLVVTLLIILSIFLSACSNESKEKAEELTTTEKTTQQVNSEENSVEKSEKEGTSVKNTQPVKENTTDDRKDNQPVSDSQKVKRDIDLSLFKPTISQLRQFTEQGEPTFTEKVIDSNNEYLQLKVQLGGSIITEIYKWNQDEITLIYQETDLENHDKSVLSNFEPNMNEVLYGKNPDWELVEKGTSLKIGDITYNNVLVIKRITQEVVGSDTIKMRYYAPKYGMIKEAVEVKGDGGYTTSVELVQE